MIFSGLMSFYIFFHYGIKIVSIILSTKQFYQTEFSYGFERVEVVLHFSNAIFAVFICLCMMVEGLHQYIDPHMISLYFDDQFMLESTLGC